MAVKDSPLAYSVVGCALQVHNFLGVGFLEKVYGDALSIELSLAHIPFERECPIAVQYRGKTLPTHYQADFVCYGKLIVELKAIKRLSQIERAQTLNYLKATGLEGALLINFATPKLQFEYFPSLFAGVPRKNS